MAVLAVLGRCGREDQPEVTWDARLVCFEQMAERASTGLGKQRQEIGW